MIDVNLLTAPLPGDPPQGIDPKYEPAYSRMQDELKKLTAVSATPVNWGVVVSAAGEVLSTVGKDIPAAAYLAVALGHTDGLAGWTAGTNALASLCREWWDTAFPPVSRLRARSNSLDWWQEHSLALLAVWSEKSPVDEAVVSAALDAVNALDAETGSRLDRLPMHEVLGAIKRLPVVPTVPEPVAQTLPDSGATTSPSTQQHTVASSAEQSASHTPAPVLPLSQPRDVAEIHAVFHEFAHNLLSLLCGPEPAADALVWKIVYSSQLGRLVTLPPAEGDSTAIPAPDTTQFTAIQQALASGRALQAVGAAAGFAPACPLWLSVYRVLAEALCAAGPDYAGALNVVRQECAALLHRLPGLERLTFADGTPLADEATQAWLLSLAASAQDSATALSPAEIALRKASALSADGNLAAALDSLENAMQSVGFAERLRLRLGQMRLLTQAQRWPVAVALAEELAAEVDSSGLSTWHPELALDIWQGVRQVWEGCGLNPAQELVALGRIARLRPSAAL